MSDLDESFLPLTTSAPANFSAIQPSYCLTLKVIPVELLFLQLKLLSSTQMFAVIIK
jgi:hypothetical protein